MTPVYVGFSTGSSVISRLIRWATGGKSSHAFLAYRSEEFGCWLQLGSEVGGWVHLPVAEIGELVGLYQAPADLWVGLRANARWLGAPYDFGGLLGMGWVMLSWRWLRRQVRNPLQSRRSWFCSEIIAQVLRDSGMALSLEPGDTDPARLETEILWLGGRPVQPPWVTP